MAVKGAVRPMLLGRRPNRSEEYRRRADEAWRKADVMLDQTARKRLEDAARTWERLAEFEDTYNPQKLN